MAPSGPEASNSHLSTRAFTFGNLYLETDGTLTRGDKVIHLPPKELTALQVLLANAGRIVTHQQLKKAIWGEVHVTDDSVTKCLSSLRELLAPEDCVQTVYKRGYRLSAEVHTSGPEAAGPRLRLVIMPFAVETDVPAYLGAAIAGEIISLLTADPLCPVDLLARDSAFALAERGMTAHEVGEALHADLVLTGTLRSLPSHLRLRAEMIQVADGTQCWVEDMLVPRARAAGIEAELANRLFVRLSSYDSFVVRRDAAGAAQRGNADFPEAYDLYRRGHQEWQTVQRQQMQEGVQHLLRAVEMNPALHAARIEFANACMMQSLVGFVTSIEADKQVSQVAQSLAAHSEYGEALLPALGWFRFHVHRDLPGAVRAFLNSVHLPRDGSITRARSMFALSRHRFDEAITLLNEALRTDPYSPWPNARLAWAYHLAGDTAKSVAQAERALDLFPNHEGTNLYGSIVLAFNGHTDRAIAVAENLVRRSPHFDLATAIHGYALIQAGRAQEARSILDRLQWLSRERYVLTSFTAPLCAALGDIEGAIAELHNAETARCPWFFQMLADPRLATLHHHPRFAAWKAMLAHMENAA